MARARGRAFETKLIAAREAVVRVPDPTFGTLAMPNVVPRLSGTPGSIRWTGPSLGEHNDEVYGTLLGLTDDEIEKLDDEKVLY